MQTLLDYTLTETLHESRRTIVYRARRNSDARSVVIKTHHTKYPAPSEIAKFRREYDIGSKLEGEGSIVYYGIEKYRHGLVLIMEDIGAVGLGKWLPEKGFAVDEFLRIALCLTDALAAIHRRRIMHKDLKPANIIINPDTQVVNIIDFGLASCFSRGPRQEVSPGHLEGTLAYMSPEQTGRMNRSVDYRTDFYSLGVTFYQMLTGQLPFDYNDPLELLHAHLAKRPAPPHTRQPHIPPVLSDIILKTLAKNAEDRYQTADGLRADLARCLKTGATEIFLPGQNDAANLFLIPEKLYGREQEHQRLLEAYDRAAAGRRKIVMCAGPPGAGKSALIHEMSAQVIARNGYYSTGKYDCFQQNIPYTGMIQAFQGLLRQLLTETEERIAWWKERLLYALGQNGQIISDLLPELDLITGPQPEPPVLPPAETQHRFQRIFREFVAVFADEEHPLVIFLDDLQWADTSSLRLIENLLNDPELHHLLFIGAYRDDEVDQRHPLHEVLERLARRGERWETLTPGALTEEHILCLLRDTFHTEAETLADLSALIYAKTAGNPFFTHEFLTTLYQQQLIRFEREWTYHLEQIRMADITNNVVELMTRRIAQLPEDTWQVVKVAACIGFEFDIQLVSTVCGRSRADLIDDLQDAFDIGLLLQGGDEVRFVHDKVAESAHSLIHEQERRRLHYKIAKALLEKLDVPLFLLAEQLNEARDVLDEEERNLAVQFNFDAGRKAKAATAYSSAAQFFRSAVDMLPANAWETVYSMSLAIHTEWAEAEYMATHYETFEALVETVLHHARSNRDVLRIYQLKLLYHENMRQFREAVELAVTVLNVIDIPFPHPQEVDTAAIEWQMSRFHRNLGDRPLAQVLDLPDAADVQAEAIGILASVIVPFWNTFPHAVPYMAMEIVNLTFEYGVCPASTAGFSMAGTVLCSDLGEIDLGYHLAELALHIPERCQDRFFVCSANFVFYNQVSFWRKPLSWGIEHLIQAYHTGVDTGNLAWAAYCLNHYCMRFLWDGSHLETAKEMYETYTPSMYRLNQESPLTFFNPPRQTVSNLAGYADNPLELVGEAFDEHTMLPEFVHSKQLSAIGLTYTCKLLLYCVLNDYAHALEIVRTAQAEMCIRANPGQFQPYIGLCLFGLTLLQSIDAVDSEEQQRLLHKARELQTEFHLLALRCPLNFSCMSQLLAAEIARVQQRNWDALEYYEDAIQSAAKAGFLHIEALTHECAAKYWFGLHKPRYAQTHLIQAYYNYRLWGARPKLRILETTYSDVLLPLISSEEHASAYIPETQSSGSSSSSSSSKTRLSKSLLFDMTSVIKASQAISSEITFERLVNRLMQIILENAGAEKGGLILEHEERYWLEALAYTETGDVQRFQRYPFDSSAELAETIVRYVIRTGENVILDNAPEKGLFTEDSYVQEHQPRSILCMSLYHKERLTGVLYLENALTSHAFTRDRVKILTMLLSQAAISLENARLFTERKRMEEEIRQLNAELEERVIQRTAELESVNKELNDFASMVSHDLKAPLRGITNLANWLVQDYADAFDADGQEMIGLLVERVQRLERFIDGILHYARIGRQKTPEEVVDLNLLLQEIIDLLSIPEHIHVTLDGSLPEVRGERVRLQQIFQNLLSNAVKFLEKPEGRISVSCAAEDAHYWTFSVSDNGPGIDARYHEKIFEIFQSLTPGEKSQNTGIGLTLVKKILESYHGEIWVESRVGEGSTFFFTLPKTRENEKSVKT